MLRKLKALVALAAGTGLVVGLALAGLAGPALATDGNGTVKPVYSTCAAAPEIKKWYGHDDESTLFENVSSIEKGLRFNGASLAHHALPATKLADLPKHAEVTTVNVTGAKPLFKIRTDAPFSTLNEGELGWWSSKILETEPGGQNLPLAGPEDFIGKFLTKTAAPDDVYTADTVGVDIQLGYATDTGNAATVTKLVYAGDTHTFACPKPVPHPAGSATGKPKPKPKPAVKVTKSPLPELALTGEEGGTNWPARIGAVGFLVLVVGSFVVYATRPRARG
jgi:hypothetical protein